MVRFSFLAIVFAVAVIGCGKRQPPQPEPTDAEQRKLMEDYARKKAPVLDRTMIENDLKSIHLFLYSAHTSTGRWPSAEASKEEIKKDPNARKLVQQIEDGTYVLVNNPPEGGILAYCANETTVGIITVDTQGNMNIVKPNELQQLLVQQRR